MTPIHQQQLKALRFEALEKNNNDEQGLQDVDMAMRNIEDFVVHYTWTSPIDPLRALAAKDDERFTTLLSAIRQLIGSVTQLHR